MTNPQHIIDAFDGICRTIDDATYILLTMAEEYPEIHPVVELHATISKSLFELRDEAARTLTPETVPVMLDRFRAIVDQAVEISQSMITYCEAKARSQGQSLSLRRPPIVTS